ESGEIKTARTSSTPEPENTTSSTPLLNREILQQDTPGKSPLPRPEIDSPASPAPSGEVEDEKITKTFTTPLPVEQTSKLLAPYHAPDKQPDQKVSSPRELPPAPPERLTRPGDGLDLKLMLLFHNNKPTATVIFNGKIIAAENISWSPEETPNLQFHFEHQQGKFHLTGDLFRPTPDQTDNNDLILLGRIDTEKNIGNLSKQNQFDFTLKLNDPWNRDDVAGEWLGWAVPLTDQSPNKAFIGEAAAIKAALRSTMNRAAVVGDNPSHRPFIMTINKIKRAGNLWIARADEKWYLLLASSESPKKVMIDSDQGDSFIGLKPFVPRPEHSGGNISRENE
ncbi:MAG: hypothetical protein OEV64_15630, partial [Desulfobulbaceae bacterium]|nr:hypothetical protein [Desulfobulbaceae bacterium]